MKYRKTLYVSIALFVTVGAACAVYFAARPAANPVGSAASTTGLGTGPSSGNSSPKATDTSPGGNTEALPTSFLGGLTAGGGGEPGGRERTYVVSYQVAFLRKAPVDKLPEENLSYQQLQAYPQTMSPYVFYGENVAGKNDPVHPEAIAVHTMIDGKQASGYIGNYTTKQFACL